MNSNKFFIDEDCTSAVKNFAPFGYKAVSASTYFLSTVENDSVNVCRGILTPHLKSYFGSYTANEAREKILITAIGNLWKKIDYLQLSQSLDHEMINEEEFIYELEKFEKRYVIEPLNDFSQEDFNIAIKIIHKISHRQFDEQEVAEMFSIPFENVSKLILRYESEKVPTYRLDL